MFWPYVIGFTLFAMVFGAVIELFNGNKKHVISTAVITGILAAIVNAGITYFFEPQFYHLLNFEGYPIMLAVNAVIAIVVSVVIYGLETNIEDTFPGSVGAGLITLAGFGLTWAAIAYVANSPGIICDNGGYQQMANQLTLTPATSPFPDTDLNELIRVAPVTAMQKASAAINQADMGSYLQPNRAYLQRIGTVGYHVVYIVDLKVTDWRAYRDRGAVVPGFVVVDAMDPKTPGEFHGGLSIKYSPEAQWNDDLDRYVYFSFVLGKPYKMDDLNGMEVDDDMKPFYPGTLLKPNIGFQGKVVDGVLMVDPQTGSMQQLANNAIPDWMDRVYSRDYVSTYIGWWASYHNHQDCTGQGKAGQEKIDDVHDVITSRGVEYQFTMTSVGEDIATTELIQVSARTGGGVIYPGGGRIVSAIKTLVQSASRKITSEGYDVGLCQLHALLSQEVWYCVLVTPGESGGNTAAYAFVQKTRADDINAVAVDPTFDGAYTKLQRIIAAGSGDNTQLSEQQQKQQYSGVVNHKVFVPVINDVGSFLFSVTADDGKTYYFNVSAGDKNAAWMKEGDRVTVTAYQVLHEQYLTVTDIVIDGAPHFDPMTPK